MTMDVKNFFKVLNNKRKKGQALIEFIIFIPFIILLYTMVLSLGSSINGAINQQKLARSYFYARVKHNSTIPIKRNFKGMQEMSMFYIGWTEGLEGGDTGVPYTTCYKVPNFFESENPGDCRSVVSLGQTVTHIKPQTVYGLCTTSYVKNEQDKGVPSTQTNSCINK
jgi:hypothetical protein